MEWFDSPCKTCMNKMNACAAIPCVCCTRNPVGYCAAYGNKSAEYYKTYGCYEKDWYRKVTITARANF